MHWFLYLLGIRLVLRDAPILKCSGFACLLLALYVHIHKVLYSARKTRMIDCPPAPEPPIPEPPEAPVAPGLPDDPPDSPANDDRFHTNNGHTYVRDSEDDDWEPYYV